MQHDLSATYAHGRFTRLSRREMSKQMVKVGGRLIRDAEKATAIAVSRGEASCCLASDGQLALPFHMGAASTLLSEVRFRAALDGVVLAESGPYSDDDVARVSGLAVGTCRFLHLFDVLGVTGHGYGYADLAAAKQIAGLLLRQVPLLAIVQAATRLATQGLHLSRARLVEAPWGGLGQNLNGRLARLDGQYALLLDADVERAADHVGDALRHEAEGDQEAAKRAYRKAQKVDQRDPVIAFNLGNVIAAQGRVAEAAIAYQRALSLDETFAEASFNLAELLDSTGQDDRGVSGHPRRSSGLCASYL